MMLPDGMQELLDFDSSDVIKVPLIKEVKTMDDKVIMQLYKNETVVITIVSLGTLVMTKGDLKSCIGELFEEPAKDCGKCLNYGCDCLYCFNQNEHEEAE